MITHCVHHSSLYLYLCNTPSLPNWSQESTTSYSVLHTTLTTIVIPIDNTHDCDLYPSTLPPYMHCDAIHHSQSVNVYTRLITHTCTILFIRYLLLSLLCVPLDRSWYTLSHKVITAISIYSTCLHIMLQTFILPKSTTHVLHTLSWSNTWFTPFNDPHQSSIFMHPTISSQFRTQTLPRLYLLTQFISIINCFCRWMLINHATSYLITQQHQIH